MNNNWDMEIKQTVRLGLFTVLIIFVASTFTSCLSLVNYEKEQEKTIASFLDKSEYEFEKKESGLYYYDYKVGKGESPTPGDSVYIHWSTFLLTNMLLNRNFDEDPAGYVLGSGQLLPGVDEAISYMKPGGFCYAIVPSHLGYGNYSTYYDPYTPTLMYIELAKVVYNK